MNTLQGQSPEAVYTYKLLEDLQKGDLIVEDQYNIMQGEAMGADRQHQEGISRGIPFTKVVAFPPWVQQRKETNRNKNKVVIQKRTFSGLNSQNGSTFETFA